jgi:hypothetical protein
MNEKSVLSNPAVGGVRPLFLIGRAETPKSRTVDAPQRHPSTHLPRRA